MKFTRSLPERLSTLRAQVKELSDAAFARRAALVAQIVELSESAEEARQIERAAEAMLTDPDAEGNR